MTYTFAKVNGDGEVISLWNPIVTGEYATDCAKGRDYADEVVRSMIAEEKPALLGWVIRGFGQDESRHGVEVGFCQRIAEWAMTQN
jgi:hypothetical protein